MVQVELTQKQDQTCLGVDILEVNTDMNFWHSIIFGVNTMVVDIMVAKKNLVAVVGCSYLNVKWK